MDFELFPLDFALCPLLDSCRGKEFWCLPRIGPGTILPSGEPTCPGVLSSLGGHAPRQLRTSLYSFPFVSARNSLSELKLRPPRAERERKRCTPRSGTCRSIRKRGRTGFSPPIRAANQSDPLRPKIHATWARTPMPARDGGSPTGTANFNSQWRFR